MMGRVMVLALTVAVVSCPGLALGQTSSIGARVRRARAVDPAPKPAREQERVQRNLIYEQYSWTASPHRPPKTFKVNDLITIIVRERTKYEADSDLNRKKSWDFKSELSAFIKPIDGGIGSTTFLRGKPNVDYKLQNNLKSRADASREDSLTTRITAKIVDVKPNGSLVLEGRGTVHYDDEVSEFCITGTVRKEDVTADNTVLSTQLADKVVKVDNKGALRSASSRGWGAKLLDLISPF